MTDSAKAVAPLRGHRIGRQGTGDPTGPLLDAWPELPEAIRRERMTRPWEWARPGAASPRLDDETGPEPSPAPLESRPWMPLPSLTNGGSLDVPSDPPHMSISWIFAKS